MDDKCFPFIRLQRAKAILDERDHQDEKWGLQDHTLDEWMTILTKWQGKLATAIIEGWEDLSDTGWRRRAIQVAAIALAMVEQTAEIDAEAKQSLGSLTPGWGPTETRPKVFNEGECD